MNDVIIKTSAEVESVFSRYPDPVRERLLHLRELIIEAAREVKEITSLEETLKWGEPSYQSRKGSTIRIDWKEKQPGQYAIYFKCTSRLVPTFRAVYGDRFTFEGNRAIVFQMDEKLPENELKSCIAAGLLYHRVKHLPRLGLERQ